MPGTWGLVLRPAFSYSNPGVRCRCPFRFWCIERSRSARWFDWAGERFRPTRLATTARRACRGRGRSRWDGCALCRLPRQTPFAPVASTDEGGGSALVGQRSLCATQQTTIITSPRQASRGLSHPGSFYPTSWQHKTYSSLHDRRWVIPKGSPWGGATARMPREQPRRRRGSGHPRPPRRSPRPQLRRRLARRPPLPPIRCPAGRRRAPQVQPAADPARPGRSIR